VDTLFNLFQEMQFARDPETGPPFYSTSTKNTICGIFLYSAREISVTAFEERVMRNPEPSRKV
jgi:hypothetical protein